VRIRKIDPQKGIFDGAKVITMAPNSNPFLITKTEYMEEGDSIMKRKA
jgi:hypothetical protein